VLDAIYRRRRWVEGVVLKGGEPLAHPETRDLLALLKDFGLPTRVDTTGTRPRALARLLDEELIDFVALELKGPLDDRYRERGAGAADLRAIYESIEVLLSGRVSHEFRVPVYEEVSADADVVRIARTIRGAEGLVLRSVPGRGPGRARLRALARLAAPYVAECRVDGRTNDAECPLGAPVGERKGA
jgi:pyruvate formate lyase activating enzyme